MDMVRTCVLADNQDVSRAGLRFFLERLSGTGRIEEAADKAALVSILSDCPGAVVVLDYTLFDLKGVEELIILFRRFPLVRWVLFSHELSETFIRRMIAEESAGLLLKDCSAAEILEALSEAFCGRKYVCRQLRGLLAQAPAGREAVVLTPAETEILKLVARGLSVKEIARERVSSVHTVVTHKKNLFRKLGVNNVYEATKYALRAGVVEMVEYYI